jgi:hypothetical protein
MNCQHAIVITCAVSSLGGFRTPALQLSHAVAERAGVRNPRMRARKSTTKLLVSANSDLIDRRTSCQPRIRWDLMIPDHDPSTQERSSLRRVQSSHRRPDGPSGFYGDRHQVERRTSFVSGWAAKKPIHGTSKFPSRSRLRTVAWGAPSSGLGRPQGVPLQASDTVSG